MAKVSAQRAADLTGVSKSTVQRAMNSGKLSFEHDSNGRRIIDVSELDRVFGMKPQQKPAPFQAQAPIGRMVDVQEIAIDEDMIAAAVEKERLSMTIKMLEQQLATAQETLDDLKSQRDKWERQASQVLITSQYSQRQAEELRAQLKEREERAKLRRLQYEERFAQLHGEDKRGSLLGNGSRPAQSNDQRSLPSSQQPPAQRSWEAEKLDDQMKKLKAENENAKSHGSVFRFWRKVTG